jgi:mannose-1-phosphate guanylyltransferase
VKGIIIAGGLGTRLRPLTYARPKHLLPVANRPFLEYQVALLRRHGVEEIVFATNYYAEKIEDQFGDGADYGVAMLYAVERELLGTAGAIRNAAEIAGDGPWIVLNGDILTDFDIGAVIAFHQAKSALATIALRKVNRPHAFGALVVGEDDRIRAWNEPTEAEKKRVAENPGPPTEEYDYINAGIYVLETDLVATIPTGRPVSIERETYPELLRGNAPVFGIAPDGYWMDIGRAEQLLAATAAVLTGAVHTDVPFHAVSESAHIAPDAELDGTTAVGLGARIGSGASLNRCIVMDGAIVGRGASLSGTIMDVDATIGEDVTTRPGVVLASGSVVERGSRL